MKTEIFIIKTDGEIESAGHINEIPWWLLDRLPQGFAGKSYAKQIVKLHPEYPKDPSAWSDEIVLTLLAQYPIDAIGNFLIGEKDLNRYQTKTIVPSQVSMNDLPALAEQSKARCCTLLSGEQPKFCCDLMSHGPCIVKFAETQKQADLLIAEHIALSILNNAGICASNSILTHIDQYQFLVIRRFDCMEHSGRLGVVSLKSLDLEFVGSRDQRWPTIAEKLAEQNVIAKSELNTIQRLFCFGRLIANSDMHTGNLSFFNDGIMPFVLTPAYDMLPMAYANIDVKQSYRIIIDSDLPDIFWCEVLPLALRFWQTLRKREDLSGSFRNISLNMVKYLTTIIR